MGLRAPCTRAKNHMTANKLLNTFHHATFYKSIIVAKEFNAYLLNKQMNKSNIYFIQWNESIPSSLRSFISIWITFVLSWKLEGSPSGLRSILARRRSRLHSFHPGARAALFVGVGWNRETDCDGFGKPHASDDRAAAQQSIRSFWIASLHILHRHQVHRLNLRRQSISLVEIDLTTINNNQFRLLEKIIKMFHRIDLLAN